MTGAGAIVSVDGVELPLNTAKRVVTDQMVKVTPIQLGCVSYLAVGDSTQGTAQVIRQPSIPDRLHFLPELFQGELMVTALPARSRVGFRFALSTPFQLPPSRSRPMTRGMIELTPSGELIILGPDGPVIGGYPVIGALHPSDIDLIGRIPIGKEVQLIPMDENKR